MLARRLGASQKFLVFERPDHAKVPAEQSITHEPGLVGVDALLIGSVTGFGPAGRASAGSSAAPRCRPRRHKIETRLIDVVAATSSLRQSGSGDATTEYGEIAGFGSKADYDETLNDRAIAAAISDVQNALMSKLQERPWRTDILKVDGRQLYMSGG